MDSNNTVPNTGQPPMPTSELWRALIVLFNRYLVHELGNYRMSPEENRPPKSVVEAIRLLDCWLDIAVHEGWLEDTQPVP